MRNAEVTDTEQARWWDGLLCGSFAVLALLCAYPFAEMGFIDDWSYVKTAWEYARTGHFIYNGWASPLQGWQVPWAALFIKVLGFSFTAARLSTLVPALLTVWIFCAFLQRSGISRRNSIFGSLMLGLSPVFLPLAASFMTDINGLFVIVLCMYMCLRAIEAQTDRAALSWLVSAALINVAAGTVRQIAWLGALVMVPSAAWLMRKRHGALAWGAVAWCASGLGIYACLQWWAHQPYSVPEQPLSRHDIPPIAGLPYISMHLLGGCLCIALLVFPLLVAWLKPGRYSRKLLIVASGLTLFLVAAWITLFLRKHAMQAVLMPWVGDIVGAQGISPRAKWMMLGTLPVSLNIYIRALVSLLVILATFLFLADLFRGKSLRELHNPPESAMSWRTALTFLGPFALAYLGLLIPHVFRFILSDRYLIGVLPVIILWLMMLYQERIARTVSTMNYAVLAIFTLYTVAGTHDWFAMNRARVRAANTMTAAGVALSQIQGGLEVDGWTQINLRRALNESRVHFPADAYTNVPKLDLPEACNFWFAPFTPVITPKYFVVLSKMPCLADSPFHEETYGTWLPPFHRAIYIQERPTPGSTPVPTP